MKINSVNNRIAFGGIFSFLKPAKISNNQQKNISNAAELAKAKLQERLVSYRTLMTDLYTGDILDQSGKKFTGKFVVPADKFEHIHHIKNGEEVGGMVRLKSGQKQWAWHGNRDKFYKLDMPDYEIKSETMKMIKADNAAEEQMRKNYTPKN